MHEGSVHETQRAVSTLGARSKQGGMKFGAFHERPDWFNKMYQIENTIRRKCKCCGRFRCTKQFSSPPVISRRNHTSL